MAVRAGTQVGLVACGHSMRRDLSPEIGSQRSLETAYNTGMLYGNECRDLRIVSGRFVYIGVCLEIWDISLSGLIFLIQFCVVRLWF